MKKQLLSIVLLILAITSFGQITITNNDIAPAGTTIYFSNDDTFPAGVVPGDPGDNKTWDFTSVIASSADTFDLLLPSSTPYGDEFPEANFASSGSNPEEGDYYSYMIRNEDKFSTIGYALSSEEFGTIINDVEPEDIILDFPVNYQNSYNEVFTTEMVIESPIPGSDSIRTISTVTKETIIDAWGSLSIPMGTYNTLRQRVNEDQVDSTFMLMSGVWVFASATEDNTTTYSWWTDDESIGFMLFSIDIDNNSAGEIYGISFFNGSAVGVDETEMLSTKVYPNPTSNLLSFEFGEFVSGDIVIMNELGQVVANRSLDNENNIQLNISSLPVGIYFYSITNNDNELLSSGKVLKK